MALALVLAAPAQAKLFGFSLPSNHHTVTDAEDERLVRLEALAGADVRRVVLQWRDVEAVRGVYGWSYYDGLMANLRAEGVRPIIVVMSAPQWAQRPLECRGTHCPPAPEHLDQWARFVYDVTKRYPEAAAIEVWNEPDIWGQWATVDGPDPERYARLFTRAAGAIHFADPTMPVLIGGITYHEQDQPGRHLTIPTFLSRFYEAGGRNQMLPQDGLSLHLYPWIDELDTFDGLSAKIMRQARGVLARYDESRRIWLTETGVTTTGPWAVTERRQARGIVRIKRHFSGMADVRTVLIHSSVEAPYSSRYPYEAGYGVIRRADLSPKPAYCALAELAAAPSAGGCPGGILADLGLAEAGGGGGGSAVGGLPGASDGDGPSLRDRARRVCRRKLRTRRWWPQATRSERRAMVRVCVRRYIRTRR